MGSLFGNYPSVKEDVVGNMVTEIVKHACDPTQEIVDACNAAPHKYLFAKEEDLPWAWNYERVGHIDWANDIDALERNIGVLHVVNAEVPEWAAEKVIINEPFGVSCFSEGDICIIGDDIYRAVAKSVTIPR